MVHLLINLPISSVGTILEGMEFITVLIPIPGKAMIVAVRNTLYKKVNKNLSFNLIYIKTAPRAKWLA